jgi:hypothetical protein
LEQKNSRWSQYAKNAKYHNTKVFSMKSKTLSVGIDENTIIRMLK